MLLYKQMNTSFFIKKNRPLYAGNSFRSSDLGVMSPARLPLRHAG
jgi:hypothetical protein